MPLFSISSGFLKPSDIRKSTSRLQTRSHWWSFNRSILFGMPFFSHSLCFFLSFLHQIYSPLTKQKSSSTLGKNTCTSSHLFFIIFVLYSRVLCFFAPSGKHRWPVVWNLFLGLFRNFGSCLLFVSSTSWWCTAIGWCAECTFFDALFGCKPHPCSPEKQCSYPWGALLYLLHLFLQVFSRDLLPCCRRLLQTVAEHPWYPRVHPEWSPHVLGCPSAHRCHLSFHRLHRPGVSRTSVALIRVKHDEFILRFHAWVGCYLTLDPAIESLTRWQHRRLMRQRCNWDALDYGELLTVSMESIDDDRIDGDSSSWFCDRLWIRWVQEFSICCLHEQ